MAVIKDVASLAGVSVGTVSKFLNAPETLKESTRLKVAQAIAELNYKPNPLARSMRTGRTNMVAVFVSEIVNPFYAEAYDYIMKAARQKGLSTMLISTKDNPQMENPHELISLAQQCDAIVLYLLDNKISQNLYDLFNGEKLTIIVSQRAECASHCITIDETKGMFLMAEHLLKRGCKNIAFLGGPKGDCMTNSKLEGFAKAVEQFEASQKAYSAEGFLHINGFNTTEDILSHGTPDAICCANDSLAIGCIKKLNQKGLNVPNDIMVTGFDDIPLCAMLHPELSTVSLPLEKVGQTAIDMIFSMDQEAAFRLDTKLIIRNSTR